MAPRSTINESYEDWQYHKKIKFNREINGLFCALSLITSQNCKRRENFLTYHEVMMSEIFANLRILRVEFTTTCSKTATSVTPSTFQGFQRLFFVNHP